MDIIKYTIKNIRESEEIQNKKYNIDNIKNKIAYINKLKNNTAPVLDFVDSNFSIDDVPSAKAKAFLTLNKILLKTIS